jgi:thioredoxin 1
MQNANPIIGFFGVMKWGYQRMTSFFCNEQKLVINVRFKNFKNMKSAKISFKDLIKSKTPVLVDFAAEWCQPCKMQKPILQRLASEEGDKIKIITIDVDRNSAVAQKYKIMSVPTLAIFKNGEIVYRQSGVHQLIQLKELVEKFREN